MADPYADAEPKPDLVRQLPASAKPLREVAYVLAEQIWVFEYNRLPGRRIAPEDVESILRSRPIAVVLDELERRMDFDDSHEWVMEPHPALDGVRPVDAVAQGRVREVLTVIETSLPPATS